MPRVMSPEGCETHTLEECIEALRIRGFDPSDEESLQHGAQALRALGNNRTFLGDRLVSEIAGLSRAEDTGGSYGPQVIVLSRPDQGDFFLRANVWPSRDEHMMRASGDASFVYGLAHDHNFDFLTIGYFGPGYWSEYYEYEYADVAGYAGEPVDLRFVERSRLEEGRILHYRAHRDVHAQQPADALSVSINILHRDPAQGWRDQYAFDLEAGQVARIVNPSSSEAFLRIAVGLGTPEALDLAERFGKRHPSDRMRFAAWDALASQARSPGEADRIWAGAEASGSRLVAGEARQRRAALENPAR
ncbi:hypothetical protein GCM10011371_10280 [Novosphingobium marinum]|uniref:Uncharacterized protein n=1 Tax=Novosphingobium marinum TaxID=1514948 RepID=A0A7Z0BSN9_9SPHN|nr:transposase [Novosphingobium marinum]NYH95136.1 hypothetical protein [Novosphingobium marinum]GGC24591.1 hypothetical protein GCM10011371_10280 [Novosphingobium marinum]